MKTTAKWLVRAVAKGLLLNSIAAAQDSGSIVAWGNNASGQCNVPAPNMGFVAIAGGAHHSLALNAAHAPGDLNCDGVVDFADINPFVMALSDPASCAVAYPDCNVLSGDCDSDGDVDFDDINPFIDILSG